MSASSLDFSGLDKYGFERKPVGIKFMITKPKGIERVNKNLSMCEMLREAQDSEPFYFGEEDLKCFEAMILGMKEPEPILVSGLLGGFDGLFKDNSACRRMYPNMPRFLKGSVQYVAFASIDKMNFDPDVVVLTADMTQAPTIMRARSYSTGDCFTSKATPVLSCAWMFVYPVISGEMNFYITGMGMGMHEMNIFPPGLFLISIPSNLLPMMMENIKHIPLEVSVPAGGIKHRERVDALAEELREMIRE